MKAYKCSGYTSGRRVRCSFQTDSYEKAMQHFEQRDHDVVTRKDWRTLIAAEKLVRRLRRR